MTDHHHPEFQVPERNRPTRAQLHLLRALALRAGQSFAQPATKAQASHEIKRLQRAARRGGETRAHDACDASSRSGSATAFRDDEITGYGISARWA
ncbi:MAG TPA: hypothetical protein VF529_00145 [Solirubrobacteraceae bacterium]